MKLPVEIIERVFEFYYDLLHDGGCSLTFPVTNYRLVQDEQTEGPAHSLSLVPRSPIAREASPLGAPSPGLRCSVLAHGWG